MDWGFIVWLILGVLGAALIAGGIVAYRRSKAVLVRSLAASAIAGGTAMWAVILFTVPITQTESVSPEPVIVTNNSPVIKGGVLGADGLAAECFHTEIAPLPIMFDAENDPTPSGFDGINSGGCTFSKLISKVSVELRNGDGSILGETFFIEPPSFDVSFPLPEGLLSEKTLALLPPGEYKRTMIAIAEDGDEWDVTANVQAALETVTVVEASGDGS